MGRIPKRKRRNKRWREAASIKIFMMQIKGSNFQGRWGSWHTGETLNLPEGPIISIVVDGHELAFLLAALAAANVHINYHPDALTPVL